MRTIQLGNKEFQLGELTPEIIKLLDEKFEFDIPKANAEGATDVGNAVCLILIAIFGDEAKALEEGKKLEETERCNLTMEQMENAFDILKEMIDKFKFSHPL